MPQRFAESIEASRCRWSVETGTYKPLCLSHPRSVTKMILSKADIEAMTPMNFSALTPDFNLPKVLLDSDNGPHLTAFKEISSSLAFSGPSQRQPEESATIEEMVPRSVVSCEVSDGGSHSHSSLKMLYFRKIQKWLYGARSRIQVKMLTSFDENCQHINTGSKNKPLTLVPDADKHIMKHKKAQKDAIMELSSHDEGFCNQIPLKLLHDPNSLLAEQIETLQDFQVAKETKSLWKWIRKSRYAYPKKGKQNLHPSKRLVILKPDQNLHKERSGNSSPATNRKNKQSEPMDVNLGENAFEISNLSAVTYSKIRESDIFVEARKHLSERLRQVEKVEALLSKQAPRSLERMLLSSAKPELMATLSPNREKHYGSVPTQMRFSPNGNSQLTYEKSFQSQNEKKISKLDDPFMTDDSSSSGYGEILEIPLEQTSTDITKLLEENSRSERLRWESPSSSTVNFCKLQIMNKEENPIPVSLEAFFENNVSGRTCTITESAEPPMGTIHLDFDEHPEINLSTDMKNKEIISAYVKKVYQTSQLDWDEFLAKGWPPEVCGDQRLLYDCIKEVLIDLHQYYVGSFIKSGIRAVSMEEMAVNMVIKEVEWYTIPRPTPHTLDQLIGKEIAESGKWVDIRAETEDIVIEIVEEALEYSILEMILDIQTIYPHPSAYFKRSRLHAN